MGIALPQFLLDIDGASGGILLLWIVGVCILLPLVIAVIYLSRSSKYTGNYVMHHTLSTYYYLMKPSLAPRYLLFALFSNYFSCSYFKLYIMYNYRAYFYSKIHLKNLLTSDNILAFLSGCCHGLSRKAVFSLWSLLCVY